LTLTPASVFATVQDVEPLYTEFGKLLRQARREAGMSQEQLASRVDMKRTSISNMEAGRQRLPLHVAYKLALALGRTPVQLLPDPASPLDEHEHLLIDLEEPQREWVRRVLTKATPPEEPS